jgi:hypothetical protein
LIPVICLVYRQAAANVPFCGENLPPKAKQLDIILFKACYAFCMNVRAHQKHQQAASLEATRARVRVLEARLSQGFAPANEIQWPGMPAPHKDYRASRFALHNPKNGMPGRFAFGRITPAKAANLNAARHFCMALARLNAQKRIVQVLEFGLAALVRLSRFRLVSLRTAPAPAPPLEQRPAVQPNSPNVSK